jgi:hypothetical protein
MVPSPVPPDMPTVALLSDFDDYYAGVMRGVVCDHTDARVVDVTHRVPRQDVRAGAFVLSRAAPYFPDDTVHCVVVDPGVGTDRDVAVVESGDQVLVGPDNGVLWPAAERLGDPVAYRVEPGEPASATFHGRDVFAPLAGRIASGWRGYRDERLADPTTLGFGDHRVDGGVIQGEVVYVDGFGNVVTNVPGEPVLDRTSFGRTVTLGDARLPFERTYGAVPPGEALCTVASHENLEIAVNRDSAAERFGLAAGDAVRFELGGAAE